MTEVSDFSQRQSGRGPAVLPEMQATAACQAAWGVTEFTLYYALAARTVEQSRAYCDYVGRLNAILKPARLTSSALLYSGPARTLGKIGWRDKELCERIVV